MKKIVERYNSQETLGLISLYPKKGELYSTGTSGIASYAKNTATHLSRRVLVLAEQTKDSPNVYEEKNNLIDRTFEKDKISMWFKILWTLFHYSAVKNLLIQFDFALYGGIMTTMFIIPFLAYLKLKKYQTHIVLHSVVRDVFHLSGHLGLKNDLKSKLKGHALNMSFRLFYLALGLLADQVIVTEDALKNKLKGLIRESKIVCIPHGVDEKLHSITKRHARKKLGISSKEEVVMFFGFINWFKGADFFVNAFKKTNKMLGKKIRFVLAGGKSATLQNKKYYEEYYEKVTKDISAAKNMQITGFVPQNKIGQYFSAADLIVFPYRYFMCASGVLSLVFSYNKPFIVSTELHEMFDAKDMARALKKVDLKKKDMTFNLNRKDCLYLTEKVLRNGLKKKMVDFSAILASERSWKISAKLYEKALFTAQDRAFAKSYGFSYAK